MIDTTKRNKNLLRVAAELAGKGSGRGEMGLDEIEVINHARPAETQGEVSEEIADQFITSITEAIISELQNIEESVGFELVDEELDYAIDCVIDNLLSEQSPSTRRRAGSNAPDLRPPGGVHRPQPQTDPNFTTDPNMRREIVTDPDTTSSGMKPATELPDHVKDQLDRVDSPINKQRIKATKELMQAKYDQKHGPLQGSTNILGNLLGGLKDTFLGSDNPPLGYHRGRSNRKAIKDLFTQ